MTRQDPIDPLKLDAFSPARPEDLKDVVTQAPDPAAVHSPGADAWPIDPTSEHGRKVEPDFGFDDEHPAVKLPFVLIVDGQRFSGSSLSVTHIYATTTDAPEIAAGTRHAAVLKISFKSFSITLHPLVTVQKVGAGQVVFQFTDPTGDHLPQLRYILNNMISGDFVSLDGLVSYTGPTEPKKAKDAAKTSVMERVRSIAVSLLSACLALAAAFVVYTRYTTSFEMHPVFVDRAGQQMRATTAGQLSYLNPAAGRGEVVYSINSNTGDVLSFQMPCDCEVAVSKNFSEGSTVLPTDLILTIFDNSVEIRVQTLMSVEGLARAMRGDRVHLDMSDGRLIPVTVKPGDTSIAANLRGDLYVPVDLGVSEGTLTSEDIGKSARLRLSKPLLDIVGARQE